MRGRRRKGLESGATGRRHWIRAISAMSDKYVLRDRLILTINTANLSNKLERNWE